jgi:hypothetical protein
VVEIHRRIRDCAPHALAAIPPLSPRDRPPAPGHSSPRQPPSRRTRCSADAIIRCHAAVRPPARPPIRPQATTRGFECTWAGDRSAVVLSDYEIVADFDGAPVDEDLRRAPGMPEALKDADSWLKLRVGATVELGFDNGERAVGKVTNHDEKADGWEVTLEETGNTWPLTPAEHTYRVLDGDSDSSEDEGGGADAYMWTEDEDRRLTSLMVEKQPHVSWATVCECLANDRTTRQVQQRWRAIDGEYSPTSQDRREAHEQLAALVSKRTRSMLSPPATPLDGPAASGSSDASNGKRGRKSDKSKPAPKLFVKESGKDTYQDWSDEPKSSRNSRQTRLVREFRALLEKAKETERGESSPRGAPSPAGSGSDDGEDGSPTAKNINWDDSPGRTLIEQTFRDGLELAEARADSDFGQFGPWVGRRILLSEDRDSGEDSAHGPGTVIGWSAGSKVSDYRWKAKTDGGGVVDLKQAELAEAMAAAEKTGILSFGERSGMQKTEDLDDVCDELDELLECALDRMGGNQIVWAKSPNFPWWPGELLSPQETRSMCLLAPRLIEEWEDDQVLVRYFGSNERVGWVLATRCLGFDEVNNVACMPSKSSKFRLGVLESMEQATKRCAELNPGAAVSESSSSRPSRGGQAAAAEDEAAGGRRRRASQKPARFRELEKSPAKKPKVEKPARKEPKAAQPKLAAVSSAPKSKSVPVQAQQPDRSGGGQTRLTPLEAHVARQTLVKIITDVWVEYSAEEKQDIVSQVNNALNESNQQAIYTVPKLNKYIQNLRYKAQTGGEPRGGGQTKRAASAVRDNSAKGQGSAKRRMPSGLSSGESPRTYDEQPSPKDEASRLLSSLQPQEGRATPQRIRT